MTRKPLTNYRLRITKPSEGHPPSLSYITRYGDKVSYIDAHETPLALSNLFTGPVAAEMRFHLEDARDGTAAAKVLRATLEAQWANNKRLCPKVEVLG